MQGPRGLHDLRRNAHRQEGDPSHDADVEPPAGLRPHDRHAFTPPLEGLLKFAGIEVEVCPTAGITSILIFHVLSIEVAESIARESRAKPCRLIQEVCGRREPRPPVLGDWRRKVAEPLNRPRPTGSPPGVDRSYPPEASRFRRVASVPVQDHYLLETVLDQGLPDLGDEPDEGLVLYGHRSGKPIQCGEMP